MEITYSILAIVLPIIGGLVGYYIKYSIDKKKELTSEITKERRELYQKFVDLIIDMWSKDKKKQNQDINKELLTFYKKYVLYASPEVIIAFSDYFQFLYNGNDSENNTGSTTKEHIKKLSNIMFEMRVDLGLENDDLGENGEVIFRAIFRDYDSIIAN